ncbi:MAG: malectin domain-containing carbohydrate-binding protein, partial [Limisphaerales bacterium]
MKPILTKSVKTNLRSFVAIACIGLAVPASTRTAWAAQTQPVIVSPAGASPLEKLAAREVRRYVYLRTGSLLSIKTDSGPPSAERGAIIVARKDRPALNTLRADPAFRASLALLKPQGYILKTVEQGGRRVVVIAGGDEVGTLYGAYRFAEHLGVRFYLHGDVIPDEPLPTASRAFDQRKGAEQLQRSSGARTSDWLPDLDEQRQPLFALRGIQPFHDFPEGPDWWNRDDYLAVIAQLPKLGMNFIGLHTYPEARPNAEPTVWIGLPKDVNSDGSVNFSYPSSYQNTLRGNWGYAAKKTGAFSFGAGELFERDDFGADVMRDACPEPTTPESCNAVFDRTGAMLRDAFRFAHGLGVTTCVGTETPLVVPKLVAERLKADGKNPADPAVLEALYEGIFLRAAKTYDLDYFWFWTPEAWTWEGVKETQVKATTDDLSAAIAAAKKISAPFRLATCGWVLGPQSDRALFDKILPKEIAVSCINREVGRTPVDKGFAEVSGRSKWAIPWLEDDPGLTSPQLWVGRMRRDAADAQRYGCDGLMGIHWRTRVLGPNVSALAHAAWDQSPWNQPSIQPIEPPRLAGPVGGQWADFPTHPITGADDGTVYQTVRFNLSAYHLPVSNGVCRVTLKFCEPHYAAAGLRVFDVKLQGAAVIENLDIFAKAGQNRSLDYTFADVPVTNGWLDIEFVPRVEFPSIAGIVVEGAGFTQIVNCGGPAYRDFAADWPSGGAPKQSYPPIADFYADWALHECGPDAASAVARIFEKIDGVLPRPCDWVNGPGGIKPDVRPWPQVAKEYEFVDELAALGPKVRGAGNRERFNYWLETFRYSRAVAELNCAWAEYNRALATVQAERDPAAQKDQARLTLVPKRRGLAQLAERVFEHLLATVTTTGELGTVANWQQHLLPDVFDPAAAELARQRG